MRFKYKLIIHIENHLTKQNSIQIFQVHTNMEERCLNKTLEVIFLAYFQLHMLYLIAIVVHFHPES